MQFFIDNGKPSFLQLALASSTSILFPNHFKEFNAAYQTGKRANPIRDWNFKIY